MSEIAKEIISIEGLVYGEKLTAVNLEKSMEKMKKNNLDLYPREFLSFLKKVNGVSYDGASIFGISNVDVIEDIVDRNVELSHLQEGGCFLGENEFDYLFYNKEAKEYQILDKIDMEMLENYSELDDAILHILSIEW
jgi:hypothetical protein